MLDQAKKQYAARVLEEVGKIAAFRFCGAGFDMSNMVQGQFYKKTHARCVFASTVA